MRSKKPLYIFIHIPKNGGSSLNKNIKDQLKPEEYAACPEIDRLSDEQKRKVKYIYGHRIYYGVHNKFNQREPKYIVFLRNPAERRVSQYNHDIARMDSSNAPSFKKWHKIQMEDEQTFLLNKKFKGKKGRKAPNFLNNVISILKIGKSKRLKILGFRLLKIYDFFRRGKRDKESEFENAKRLIEKCWLVSTTDSLNYDIPKILGKMGLNKNWKKYRSSKSEGEIDEKHKKEVRKYFELDEETHRKINRKNPYDLKLYNYIKKFYN